MPHKKLGFKAPSSVVTLGSKSKTPLAKLGNKSTHGTHSTPPIPTVSNIETIPS